MANVVTGNPLEITEIGVISTVGLRIQKIVLKPAATGDAATFTYWLESDSTVTTYGDRVGKTTTVTASSGTFASVGNFETDNINANQIIKFYASSTGENIGNYQIATNANDDTITVSKPASVYGGGVATLSDDTSMVYSWKVWDPRTFLLIKGSGVTGDTGLVQIDFGDRGFWVPNLAMHTLSSNATLLIYLNN